MWLNFKDNAQGNYATAGPAGKFPQPPSSGKAPELSRQNSTRSSRGSARSGKSATSKKKLLSKLEEHELNTKTSEWGKNQDYKMIRARRKAIRKQIDAKLRVVRRLFIPSIVGIILGIVVLFGATIRTLSDGTVFWTFREQFKIIGPIIIVLGIVLLFTAIGLENHSMDKLKKAGIQDVKPVIHPDFLIERTRYETQTSKDSSGSSYDPDCIGLDRQRLLWKINNQDEEDGFLCSSITSASSGVLPKGDIDLTARCCAGPMEIDLDDRPNHVKFSLNREAVDDTVDNAKHEKTYLHTISTVPGIEVTGVDEISRQSTSSSAITAKSVSFVPFQASSQKSGQEMNESSSKDASLSYKNGSIPAKDIGHMDRLTEDIISQIEQG